MASPSELTLDYNPNSNPTSYPLIQKSTFGDQPESTSQFKLEDFLARLEEERHKIEAFKRELPLCMQLLNNAMETYRRQLETYQNNSNLGPRPVLEEFIPLSNMSINCSEKLATPTSEKANWMVSAQLWSPATAAEPTNTKLALDTKQRNGSGGGAFLPFTKEKTSSNKGFGPGLRALPELALAASVEKEEVEEKKCEVGSNGGVIVSKGVVGGVSESKGGSNGNEGQAAAVGGQSTHRKARRCWSPDLHRRFVNALQMLGGSQVATPKQIRELMKVDGLTNDEVKSHLQKYRLHTRRPIQPPHPPATAAPQLVVLGGIWVPPEYASAAAAAAAAGGPTIYPAAPAAAHYPVAHHDFYAAPPPPGTHQHLHRATAMAGPYGRARVAAAHSPESELRSSGDRSESIEDGEEGEEREAEDDDEDDEQLQEEMEEAKAEDNKALVPVEGNGNVGDVALKF